MSRFSFQFFSPLFLFFLLLLDGQLTHFFTTLAGGSIMPVSHLLLIFMVYTVTQHRHSYVLIVGVLLGIVYDSYFLGIFGIASLILPLIALFVYQIQTVVFTNRWTRLFTVIIIVFAFQVLSTLIVNLVGVVNVNFVSFIVKQLAPTLALNIIFAILLQWPLEKMYRLR
ncbi:rod shape-determining protein MreD [Lactococcus garvieae]|uniref:rod shape-determining protein MreD n=1 Tax=Lactococcus garvieae TaxID=1363 RepID=UPI001A8F8EE5|nr:rod shape-determining protein MreD [Lactococcus garvieae]QSR00209.1 rod shape-determining protein MreD [Lactococcus garvieae]